MKNEIYEDAYKKSNHFSFGKNWQDFLKTLNNEKIEEAKKSLVDFLDGEENIKDKTFIDIGCGSGLFSYAAYKLGAAKVVSVDVDEFSVACATHLKEKEGNPENWEIKKGSVLDSDFILSLGRFDIAYSWGVLHHTGDMYKAFDNILKLMQNDSLFYLAIYNKFTHIFKGGTSETWYKIKGIYNNSGYLIKKIMEIFYSTYSIFLMLLRFKNPFEYIKNYKGNRGMSWHHDNIDWIGGYPYEFASIQEIISYFGKKEMYCKNINAVDGLGCNEFLLIKK